MALAEMPTYSSIAAFLAHLHALEAAPVRSPDEDRLLAAMRACLGTLSTSEREAIAQDHRAEDSRMVRYHRERAERKLSRDLMARGVIAG